MLAAGDEDLNDHAPRRRDLALQTALERDTELASGPTLCRLEQRVDRTAAVAFHRMIIEQFIASLAEAPTELILDFDATDHRGGGRDKGGAGRASRVHGQQEGRFYHGYYGNWCFLPLSVFGGEQLLASYLRPSNRDGARHAWAILKLLTQRRREAWPEVKLIVRADSGCCRWKMLQWCDWARVDYIIGLARNQRLEALGAPLMAQAEAAFALATGHHATRARPPAGLPIPLRLLGGPTSFASSSRRPLMCSWKPSAGWGCAGRNWPARKSVRSGSSC